LGQGRQAATYSDIGGAMASRRLVTFDWALKRLLRSKANFEILEGFVSELIGEPITILEILESESNRGTQSDKANRVDLKVINDRNEILIIEIQYERQMDYLQRVLYGVSKAITEHIDQGDPYAQVAKVISISILHFDLGQGSDYVYRGTTVFRGIHQNDELQLSESQKDLFQRERIADIYPEYYLLKVNQFDGVAKDSLDEWLYFLKNGEIREGFKARGLLKAKTELDVLKLNESERRDFERFQEELHYQASMFESSWGDGHRKGIQEGKEQGIQEGKEEGIWETKRLIARSLLDTLEDKTIANKTGLSLSEIQTMRKTESGFGD
jgi:predicted transposase/invertase (TIGR01784 family)